MEEAAHFALNVVQRPLNPALIKNSSASKKTLKKITEFHREAVSGSILSNMVIPELERRGVPLANYAAENPEWDGFIVNNTLQREIAKAVQANSYQQLRMLLDNYYSLQDGQVFRLWNLPLSVFVDNATEYFFKYGRIFPIRISSFLK